MARRRSRDGWTAYRARLARAARRPDWWARQRHRPRAHRSRRGVCAEHQDSPGGKIWVGRNAIRVNGFAVPYLRNSRHEAARAAKLHTGAVGFDVVVRPALVFLTGTLIPDVTIKQRPDDVLILDRRDVPKAFRRASTKLDVSAVQAIYDHSRRSTTWSFSKLTGHVERLAAASDRC